MHVDDIRDLAASDGGTTVRAAVQDSILPRSQVCARPAAAQL